MSPRCGLTSIDVPPALPETVGQTSGRLDAVVRRGMGKAPEDRYPSAGDLAGRPSRRLRTNQWPCPSARSPPGAAAPGQAQTAATPRLPSRLARFRAATGP